MVRKPEKGPYQTILTETLVDLTTFAPDATIGSVGTMIVGFIRTTMFVIVGLGVDKTGLDRNPPAPVVDFGLAQLALAIIFLGERMDSQIGRQMLQGRYPMLVSTHGFFNWHSFPGIKSTLPQ